MPANPIWCLWLASGRREDLADAGDHSEALVAIPEPGKTVCHGPENGRTSADHAGRHARVRRELLIYCITLIQ